MVYHFLLPNADRGCLAQGHPGGIVPKMGLKLTVFQFLGWCLKALPQTGLYKLMHSTKSMWQHSQD